jgi:hypothetical protein
VTWYANTSPNSVGSAAAKAGGPQAPHREVFHPRR